MIFGWRYEKSLCCVALLPVLMVTKIIAELPRIVMPMIDVNAALARSHASWLVVAVLTLKSPFALLPTSFHFLAFLFFFFLFFYFILVFLSPRFSTISFSCLSAILSPLFPVSIFFPPRPFFFLFLFSSSFFNHFVLKLFHDRALLSRMSED